MLGGTKTLTNLFSQLHRRLEGKAIIVGDFPKLNIPFEFFFSRIIPHSLDCRSFDTSFSIWGGLFPPPTITEKYNGPFIVSSLKLLEDHLF